MDKRILGLAIGGSWKTGEIDQFSDLDFVIVIDDDSKSEITDQRFMIAESLGSLVNVFTGEHVGEPRLLICLYDDPPIHVDLVFKTTTEFHHRVENPVILWERENALSSIITTSKSEYPSHSLQWMEDRFWTWVHYCSLKLGRGEIFEFIDGITFMRSKVIGPLLLQKYGRNPSGVRRIEFVVSEEENSALAKTVPAYNSLDCYNSLLELIKLYTSLREVHQDNSFILRKSAEEASMKFLDTIGRELHLDS